MIVRVLVTVAISYISARSIRLSGIRDGSTTAIEVDSLAKFSLEIFGRNLGASGYYLTTAARCEDWNRTDLGPQVTYFIKHAHSYDRYAYIEMPEGIEFNSTASLYHLCYTPSTFYIYKYLVIKQRVIPSTNYWPKYLLCIYCVIMAAYSSGMTLGFMKFPIAELNRMMEMEEPTKTRARRILPFRKRSNWLVCTFSMFSTLHTVIFTTQVESFFAGIKYDEVLSMLVPTVILLVFAEMIPQAVCNSKFGFVLASSLWPVNVVIFLICAPIAWPASKIIDRYLGREVREVMTEEEKMNYVRNMAKKANRTERKILEKATEFSSKSVEDVMTVIDKVFLLPSSQKLNKAMILTLVEKGFTRVPIRDEKDSENIYAVLNIKDLLSMDLSHSPTVSKILAKIDSKTAQMKYVMANMQVQLLMQQMRTGGFHIATVIKCTHSNYKVVGIITIEDILEQIFGEIVENPEKTLRHPCTGANDDYVINWCREAGTESRYPLSFSQQLLVIQSVLDECHLFRRLGFDTLKMKLLLSTSRIRKCIKNESLPVKDVMIIVFDGTLEIKRDGEVIPQNLLVKKIDKRCNIGKVEGVQVFIVGHLVLRKVAEGLHFANNYTVEEKVCEVICRSETCSFFKLRIRDITDLVNENSQMSRTDEMHSASTDGEVIDRGWSYSELMKAITSERMQYGLANSILPPISDSSTTSPAASDSLENVTKSMDTNSKTYLLEPRVASIQSTQLNLLASGKTDYFEMKSHAPKCSELKFQYFVKKRTFRWSKLFEASFITLSTSGEPFCGKCQCYLKLVKARPQRLFNAMSRDVRGRRVADILRCEMLSLLIRACLLAGNSS
ncbi:unnamed protein product [Caenorhabditis bovis]|uniref:Metal transporter n=1 Tax=Caenorhabditis bovis TaxID=2654633 RepID=A0A8S1EH79_9PELO|nr:unnamed protein product [Caenorhabditis bovis]